MTTSPQHQHVHQQHHAHDSHEHDGDLTELLDLDADVLTGYLTDVVGWLPVATPPRRILDLGTGTGGGAFALLDRFPDASVTAVDVSAAYLQRVREKAEARGLGERVRTVQADLDGDWPDLGTPDLVWSSAAIHHLADPDRGLRAIRDLLTRGGLFALVELADFPRFLPADAPAERPGLEDRWHEVTARSHADRVPHLGSDWGPRLVEAGFELAGERAVTVDIDGNVASGGDEVLGRYALATIRRVRETVGADLDPADLAAIDRLLDVDGPGSIMRRHDLAVHTERQVWAALRR
ncbi:hypothetical protein GCM10011512_07660 [Tersicoccus solisilvae]|uniref:Methyltransferase domain-containing protein n=1 Tax=Tersicoccus solisilvae TaxID=1882339 RepID=A0ABQ1NR34_9MICC|nr:class I SAM-dependent methyltransferase [Tersicoccus solisilvae]GGC83360.1 hypothetical protein GCM10011512_07660 [Tersicoccus solisilvae]